MPTQLTPFCLCIPTAVLFSSLPPAYLSAAIFAVTEESVTRSDEMLAKQAEFMEKQDSLLGTIDRVLNLQNSIVGHFFDIKAVIFFLSALVVSFMFTSTHRTEGARFGVLFIFFAEFATESATCRMLAYHGWNSQTWTSALRLGSIVCSFLWTFIKGWSYTDQSVLILSQLQEQQREFNRMVEKFESRFDHVKGAVGGVATGFFGQQAAAEHKPAFPGVFKKAGNGAPGLQQQQQHQPHYLQSQQAAHVRPFANNNHAAANNGGGGSLPAASMGASGTGAFHGANAGQGLTTRALDASHGAGGIGSPCEGTRSKSKTN
jgi:hypothetical protein